MSEDNAYASDYNDIHRTLLQAIIARQCLAAEDARPLLAGIIAARQADEATQVEQSTQEELDSYVHAINDRISPFDLEIRSTRHQRTNVHTYALVNTTSDALTQMATIHTADEIAFIRRVLDAMFEAHNTLRAEIMAVTGMQMLKLAKPSAEEAERRESGGGGAGGASVAALTGVQAEAVMKDMVTERWLEQIRIDGTRFYTLAPRALLELREWLVDTYNAEPEEDADAEETASCIKIRMCAACKEIVTIGQRCSRQTCLGRLHEHCSARMFRAQGGREVCPVCETSWDGYMPVGPKAAAASTSRSTNGVAPRAGRATHSAMIDDGEDSDDG